MTIVDERHAPGRKVMVRANGRRDVYWVARADAVAAGYVPKTVRLINDPGEQNAPLDIAAKCRQWWAEMLEFVAGRTVRGSLSPAGTLGWLIEQYQADAESPYQAVREITRVGYDKSLQIIKESVGARRLDTVTAKDLRRWHRNWGRADDAGVLANPRRAYGCIQLMRILANFGIGMRFNGCPELSAILSATEFPVPKGRKQAMTFEHATAIIAAARSAGAASIARATALQFACALRQKDVIGEWTRDGAGQQRWRYGLLWGEHIKVDLKLAKPTSKSNFEEMAEIDLALIPMVRAELETIPSTQRIGPLILNERTGQPYRQREFARRFREIARAAGVPDSVWNMDARAGAITDAYDSGASDVDAMDLGTHRQLSTNLRYKRGRMKGTSRVTELRFGRPRPPGKSN